MLLVIATLASTATAAGLVWEDWDRLQVCHPLDYSLPATESELVALLIAAHADGRQVKVCGAGHSFSPIALTDDGAGGHMVSLDKLDRVLSVTGTLVTVEAGIRLHDLNAQLEARGLSLVNMGATCEQSVAGATATGTHGTGIALGSMSTQIEGLRIALANGTLLDTSATSYPTIFAAARVGLGALGVVTQVSIRAQPLFQLRLNHTTMPLDDLLAALPALLTEYPRLQYYWLPPDEENATLLTRELMPAGTLPSPTGVGCWGDNEHVGRHGEPSAWSARNHGVQFPHQSCTDVSYKALCGSPAHYAARNLYTEMEMFVPLAFVGAAVAQFRAFQRSVAPLLNATATPIFTGVRYVAADDITLSPQHGRANAVISFVAQGMSKTESAPPAVFARYAEALEAIAMGSFEGRPHWGKMNWANATSLRVAYGGALVDRFLALRHDLDPTRMFVNAYLTERGLGGGRSG